MKDKNVKQYYAEIGGLPAKVALFQDPAFAKNPYVSQFKADLEQARSRPAVAGSNDVDAALGKAVQAALSGTKSPKEALDAAVAFVTALRWLILSPMFEPGPAPTIRPHRHAAGGHFYVRKRPLLRGHFW